MTPHMLWSACLHKITRPPNFQQCTVEVPSWSDIYLAVAPKNFAALAAADLRAFGLGQPCAWQGLAQLIVIDGQLRMYLSISIGYGWLLPQHTLAMNSGLVSLVLVLVSLVDRQGKAGFLWVWGSCLQGYLWLLTFVLPLWTCTT